MPHDDPKKRPASWRDVGGEQPAATPGKRGWQQLQESSRNQPGRPWSKRTKLLVAGILLGLVAGGIVIVLQYIKPIKPAAIVLVGSGYETNLLLPPNVAGWQGLHNVKKWADDSRQITKLNEPTELKNPKTWKQIADGLPQTLREQTLLLYLSLHGGADDKGAYLLADDETGQTKVHVTDILNDLVNAPALKEKNIVVVLDTPHVETHWPTGMFHNAFMSKLKEQWPKYEAANPNLYVLCACDADQVSWASEKLQSTMFTHYFQEGLRGGADLSKNGRISLKELLDYLKSKVGTWVESNRNVMQTPHLLGNLERSKDVDLAKVESDGNDDRQPPGKESYAPGMELLTEWEAWGKLKASAPWTFAPHLWRRYQDAVVRLEYLDRLGDPTKKKSVLVQTVIGPLKIALESLTPLDAAKGCVGNSIALAHALGLPNLPPDDIEKLFRNLQDNRDNAAAWTAFNEKFGSHPPSLAPLLGQAVLENVLAKNQDLQLADLRKAAAWWKAEVEYKLGPKRPVEVQFLAMLARDADYAPGSQLHLALKVRRLAEWVVLGREKAALKADSPYSYAEFVYPWIASQVEEDADKSRRIGEDWLFGGTEEHFKRAETNLQDAKKKYEEIQKDAAVVRHALAIQDQAWADLPALAQWLATQPTKTAQHKALLALTRDLERLTDHLKKPGNAQADLEGNPPIKLAALTQQVASQRATLLGEHLQQCVALGNLNIVVQHQDFHDIEAALSLPLMDVGKRETLIIASRRITWKLDSGTGERVVAESEAVAKRTERHQTLAQAVYKSCLDAINEKTLAAAVPKLPGAIQKSLDDSLDKTDLGSAANELIAGAHLCRLVPGGLGWAVNEKAKPFAAPPQALRQLRMHHLLKAQGKRTLEDHYWEVKIEGYDAAGPGQFNDLAEKMPYYVAAAKAYVNSAKGLAESRPEAENQPLYRGRMQACKDLDDRLVAAGVSVTSAGRIFWTTEQQMDLKWNVLADPGVPLAATAMHWRQVDYPGSASVKRDAVAPLKSQTQVSFNTKDKDLASVENWLQAKDRPELRVELMGVFRGQRFGGKASTIVLERRKPDIIVQHFQPPPAMRAGVALRMTDKFTYGAVSIVLDTSGSMNEIFPDGKGKTRFEYALEAVKKCLTDLPDDTYLSIQRFRSKKGDAATGLQFVEFANVPVVQKWIQKWNVNRIDTVMEELGRSKFELQNNNSPIAKAIKKSADEGFPEKRLYDGPKVILVLTDGADNESVKKGTADYDKKVSDMLAKISDANPETQIVVVCFLPKGDSEETSARNQFEIVNGFGRFELEQDAKMLARTLEELMRPRLRLDPKQPDFPLTANLASSSTLEWKKIDPALYKTKIQSQATDLLNPLSGHSLFLEIREKNRRVVLERGIVGRQKEMIHADKGQNGDWLTTLYEHSPGRTLEQVVLLEKTVPTLPIGQVTPALVWLEVDPLKGQPAGLIRWHNDWNIAAPAYRLRAHEWPNNQQGEFFNPRLKVWWTEAIAQQGGVWNLAKGLLQRDGGFAGVYAKGFVESILPEEREIEVSPNKTAMRKCLVFRVHLDTPAKRVWIRYTGKQLITFGEEHQFFNEAGKYTATFYVQGGGDIQGRVDIADFEMICLTTFKDAALEKTFTPTQRIEPVSIFYHRLDEDH